MKSSRYRHCLIIFLERIHGPQGVLLGIAGAIGARELPKPVLPWTAMEQVRARKGGDRNMWKSQQKSL